MSKEKLFEEIISNVETVDEKQLVLYNDDFHTFDFVIDTLIEVCHHDYEQAEQCAMITHYNGRCDVKRGLYSVLKPMKEAMQSRELSVVIE